MGFMKRTAVIAALLLFAEALFGLGGVYYPPRTAVNTVRMVKAPLEECAVANYTLAYSFERESDDEWWKRVERGKRVMQREKAGYLIETRFMGETYYVYELNESPALRITLARDRSKTVACFSPPRYIMGIAAFPHRMKGKDYLVVYISQQASSHSSTLLVFDGNFRIVFQDHLLGALEIGRDGERIVVKSEDRWYPEGKRVSVVGSWVYFIP